MIKLGTGILTWDRSERVTDRYGTVYLINKQPDHETGIDCSQSKIPLKKLKGRHHGSLIAVVTETRKSGHIGDFFHGILPRTPAIGATIHLGNGTLFYIKNAVGLQPDDGRETQWLDIRALYDVHEQTVNLYFKEDN